MAVQKVIDYLQPDFIEDVRSSFDEHSVDKILSEEMTNELLHSCNVLRPGDSFSFYSLPLYVIARLLKPSVIVETGVQNGGSTQTLLSALRVNSHGNLHSIDSAGTSTDRTHNMTSGFPGERVTESLKSRWDLRIGFTSDLLLPLLEEKKKFNLFFHDSDHSKENVEFEFNVMKKYAVKGSCLGLHDHYGQWNHAEIFPSSEYEFIIGHRRPEVHSQDGKYHNVLRLWRKK